MVVVVFRSRIRPGAEDAINDVGGRMYELAVSMPGFVSYKDFVAEDGEGVAIVEFDTLDHLAAWRDHPEHRQAQQRGRGEFFSAFHIQVCETVRDYHFTGGA